MHSSLPSSLSQCNSNNRVILSPIKKPRKKKVLQQKENRFVLDCTNIGKSKLDQYNYLKDKYLNYCVVKIPKRKRFVCHGKNTRNFEDITPSNNIANSHNNFKSFLASKREEIILKSTKVTQQCLKHQNGQRNAQQKEHQMEHKKADQTEQTKTGLQKQSIPPIDSQQQYSKQEKQKNYEIQNHIQAEIAV